MYQAGRGTGKTRSAVEEGCEHCRNYPQARVALVGRKFGSARDVLVEGASGFLAVLPKSAVKSWNRSMGELVLSNGAQLKCIGSTTPELLRGPEYSLALCDELGSWDGRDTWDNLLLALRAGPFPKAIITTTPARTPLFRELAHDPRVMVIRESTYANKANLPQSWLDALVSRYEGTTLGRQEVYGDLIEDVKGAQWTQALIDLHRVSGHVTPYWLRSVVGLDPADGIADGDEQGLALVSQSPQDQHFYVRRSEGYRLPPWEYLKAAVDLAYTHGAMIAVEKNHGGQYLMELLDQVMDAEGKHCAVVGIPTTASKRDRAQPVAGLYEQGRVHHVGYLPELESELTTFVGLPGVKETSPNRMDALVHALAQFTTWRKSVGAPLAAAVPYTERALPTITNPAIPYV
jgi:phage terminase large subunit-like protein